MHRPPAGRRHGRTRRDPAARCELVLGLRAMGAQIDELDDGFVLRGPVRLHGAEIDAAHDHRIAMSFAIALAPSAAMAQSVQVGTLLCHVSGGVGMIIIENQALDCVYTDAKGSPPQHYIGRLTNVGANIGISGPGQLVWKVLAATNSVQPGALAGDYVGAEGSLAVGAGAGGALLVGGSNKTISLQPLSVSLGTGANLSAGIGNVSLQYMPVTPPPPPPAPPAKAKKVRAHR